MIARSIRDFISRDWKAARDAKDAYWGERIRRLGPAEGVRMGDELRRQALRQDPAWPRPEDRRQDLLSHARLTELLHRAAATRRR
jgi:hypothetical protein